MFWAAEITPSKSYTHPETPDESGEGDAFSLHVSNLSLVTGKKTPQGARYRVYAQTEEKKFVIGNLKEGAIENYSLDLYFKQSEKVTFSLAGKGEASVHLTGYFEASGADFMDGQYDMDPMGMEMNFEDEDDDIETDPMTKDNIALAKANALKNATMGIEDDSEDDSDEEVKEIIPKKAPEKKVQPKKEKKPVVEEDSDSDDEVPQAVPTPIVEDSDDESEDDAPVVNKKSIPFEDSDSDDSDSDDFNVKAVLAQRKRKAVEKKDTTEKKQKVTEKTEAKPKTEQKPKGENKTPEHKPSNDNQNKGGKKRNRKNKNKNKNKNKGKN
ncbi:unnamed protein product [Moneuplotes crassus]|uniref:Nucleoplasmin-like domain-containing protein n=1 Tax=Euplotes crassus TaxID=5936 RepID=A0AAD1XI12_EUPCR|nr:unnamed protein product [Moneuplotes crassus]